MEPLYIALAVPVFFLLMGMEYLVSRRMKRSVYRWHDSINSVSCGIAQQMVGVFLVVWVVGSYAYVWENWRVAEIPSSASWAWLGILFGVDFAYYWFHRVSHRVNFVWATHVVHHQSEDYNLSTALRQSMFQPVIAALFYLPLAVMGFPVEMFVGMVTINTLYQFWIHTRLVDRMGFLEWFLNTPSHHRVHHGIDPEYIDKNYAGMFIIWDRLFGSFIEEKREPSYGTVQPLQSWNPVWANFEHFKKMAALWRGPSTLAEKLWIPFAPPEWQPAKMGGKVAIPKVDRSKRKIFETPHRSGFEVYAGVQFLGLVFVALLVLVGQNDLSTVALTWSVGWVVLGVTTLGWIFEARRGAVALELIRLAIAVPMVMSLMDSQSGLDQILTGALSGGSIQTSVAATLSFIFISGVMLIIVQRSQQRH